MDHWQTKINGSNIFIHYYQWNTIHLEMWLMFLLSGSMSAKKGWEH